MHQVGLAVLTLSWYYGFVYYFRFGHYFSVLFIHLFIFIKWQTKRWYTKNNEC